MTTSGKIKSLKVALKGLEEKEKATSVVDAAWELEPENPDLEKAFDDAYRIEFAAFMAASAALTELIGVDQKTARAMINGKRVEVWNILNRAI